MTRLRHSFLFVAVASGLASTLSLLGGIGLEHVSERLLPIVPLLIAVPALNNLVGDYATVIAAHTGDPGERPRTRHELLLAISRVLTLNIIAVIVLSLLLAMMRGYVLEPDFVARFILFITAAIVAVVGFMLVLTRGLDRVLLRSRLNPDDLLIPITTSVADILMLSLVAFGALTVF